MSPVSRFFRSRDKPKAELPISYSCMSTFSPFAPRSLPASQLLWTVRLPRSVRASRASQVPRPSILTRRPQSPRRAQWCRPAIFTIGGRLHPMLVDWPLSLCCNEAESVRFHCGSQVRLARLRVGDCSHSSRLRGYVDERVISAVSSFQLTRCTRLRLAHQQSQWTSDKLAISLSQLY